MKLFHFITAAVLIAFCFCSCAAYNNHITGSFIGDDGQRYVKVSPSWKQAYQAAAKSDKTVFWLSNSGAVICFGLSPVAHPVLPIAGIGFLASSGGSLEWYKWNCDKALSQTRYDSLKAMGVKDIYSAIK